MRGALPFALGKMLAGF